MSKRVMGKASFCNLQDLQGNIQSYVARDEIGEEAYKEFKKMDIGDIVGITRYRIYHEDRRDFHSCKECRRCSPRVFRSFRRSSTD